MTPEISVMNSGRVFWSTVGRSIWMAGNVVSNAVAILFHVEARIDWSIVGGTEKGIPLISVRTPGVKGMVTLITVSTTIVRLGD